MKPECVVLDLDDTIYPELDFVWSGFRAVGDWAKLEFGVADFESVCISLFKMGVKRSVFRQAIQMCGIPQDRSLELAMVGLYRHHSPNIHLDNLTRCGLDAMVKSFQVALLTGGFPATQEAKVTRLGLSKWCGPIIYSGQWGPAFDKPHERSFRLMEDLTGMRGKQLAYVADNPLKDARPALKCGWHFIRMRQPCGLHHGIEDASQSPEVNDWSGLLHHLEVNPAQDPE